MLGVGLPPPPLLLVIKSKAAQTGFTLFALETSGYGPCHPSIAVAVAINVRELSTTSVIAVSMIMSWRSVDLLLVVITSLFVSKNFTNHCS